MKTQTHVMKHCQEHAKPTGGDIQSQSSLYAEYARCIGPPKHQGAPLLSKIF